jgi:hypothetical protein
VVAIFFQLIKEGFLGLLIFARFTEFNKQGNVVLHVSSGYQEVKAVAEVL